MEQGCILEIRSQVGGLPWGMFCLSRFQNSPFLLLFLKLAFFDENMCTTFSPRLVCLRILIILQDDSLESVVDACLFSIHLPELEKLFNSVKSI